MDRVKKERLEARGWKVGTVQEFLSLSPQEAQLIELKAALARQVREQRTRRHLTQVALAKLIDSSQSRVAKIEAGDPSVSVDLMLESLFALGASVSDVADMISTRVGLDRESPARREEPI